MSQQAAPTARNTDLLHRRLELDLTQEELARAAGVTSVTVLRAEKGFRIRYGKAFRIARALGVALEDLFPPEQLAG